MSPHEKPFLTTDWRLLAMLNYEVDPQILLPLLPQGTELNAYQGKTFVSMVGFRFERTRLLGWPVPFHQQFPEVNLRFYVRRRVDDRWRRGVVFVREIVPRRAAAFIARTVFDENMTAMPVRCEVEPGNETQSLASVEYRWRYRGQWQRLAVQTSGLPQPPVEGSQQQFITEHYWGYTAHANGSTSEFRVDHPSWKTWQARTSLLQCDAAGLYGPQFAEFLSGRPDSALVAEGSPVKVYRGKLLQLGVEQIPTENQLSEENIGLRARLDFSPEKDGVGVT